MGHLTPYPIAYPRVVAGDGTGVLLAEPRKPVPSELMAIDPGALEQAFFPFLMLEDDASEAPDVRDGVALVEVRGPLASRRNWMADGYHGPGGIVDRVRAAAKDPATRALVLHLNTPGGDAPGMLEAIDAIRAASAHLPVVAFADTALSAGYALATAAERVHVARAGQAGSIGVLATARSFEKALEKEGVAVVVAASGAYKTDLHPALPLSEAALGRLRAQVQALAGLFADEVARARPALGGRDAVLALQAAKYLGPEAVAAGLCDEVSTLDGAIDAARRLAEERAARAAEERSMKTVAESLGLAAGATEAEMAARAGALRELEAALCKATGEAGGALALAKVAELKRDAAQLAALGDEIRAVRQRAEAAEAEERAAYVRDVLLARGLEGDEVMRAYFAREAAADFEAFKQKVPRPPPEVLAARAQDAARLGRLPKDPKTPVREDADAALAAEAKSVGMDPAKYRAKQAELREKGLLT